jgi:hypothetical protein
MSGLTGPRSVTGIADATETAPENDVVFDLQEEEARHAL